jgi:hypothetical protein
MEHHYLLIQLFCFMSDVNNDTIFQILRDTIYGTRLMYKVSAQLVKQALPQHWSNYLVHWTKNRRSRRQRVILKPHRLSPYAHIR